VEQKELEISKYWSYGITLFGLAMVAGNLFLFRQLKSLDVNALLISYQPLPDGFIRYKTMAIIGLMVLGTVAGIGVLLRKEKCRKLALWCSFFSLLTYSVELPFLVIPNNNDMIQYFFEKYSQSMSLDEGLFFAKFWRAQIIHWGIDFVFTVCLVAFFTRWEVKDQFE